jgi:hypothetical protein
MLINLTEVKTFLKKSLADTSEDALLKQIIGAVDAEAKKFFDRQIEQATYTDYYDGNNSRVLLLNEYPVTSVASVYEDTTAYWGSVTSSFGTTTLLTSGIDYALALDGRNGVAEAGRIFKLTGVWSGRWDYRRGNLGATIKPMPGSIKVTYTAGYASGAIPQDIKLGLWQVCSQVRATIPKGYLLQSESLGEYSYALAALAVTYLRMGTTEQLLSRYRRVRERFKPLG